MTVEHLENGIDLDKEVDISPAVRVQLREYVTTIANMYRDVPFHNFEHCSHVIMSASK